MNLKFFSSTFFSNNRKYVAFYMKDDAFAIVNSAVNASRNGDQNFGFRQSSDLFYLTGIAQENTVLILCPLHKNKEMQEVLFIEQTNDKMETWQGKKLDLQTAQNISGIKNVQWRDNLERVMTEMFFEYNNVYLNANENLSYKPHLYDSDYQFIKTLKDKYLLHNFLRLAPLITKKRLVKTEEEVEVIRHAIQISKEAFLQVLRTTKSNIYEYEIEAEITYIFRKNNIKSHAYQPIVASGANACILHYIQNDALCKDGELVLLDFGAEYQNYASDVSRTIPVNGKFTERQKIVYQAVLNVLYRVTRKIACGKTIRQLNKEAAEIMRSELFRIGLLSDEEISKNPETAHKKYFMHGVSHFIGLDVHDVGTQDTILSEGMIISCEPGIYIKEERLGIRLENDILLTKWGNINLSEEIPIEISDIEKLMA